MMNTNTRKALNNICELVEQMNNIIENIMPELEIEANIAEDKYEESYKRLLKAETNTAITDEEFNNIEEETDKLRKVKDGYMYLTDILNILHNDSKINVDDLRTCLRNYLS